MVEVVLTKQQYLEFEKIAVGAFAPLTGFMNSQEYISVIETMRLPSGEVFPLPIILDVTSDKALEIKDAQEVSLLYGNELVGTLTPEDIYSPDKEAVLGKLFGTEDRKHPGADHFLNSKPYFVGGAVSLKKRMTFGIDQYELTPSETKAKFLEMGLKTITGFQTRNVPHRAHEHLQRASLELTDGLFIQPLVGWKKIGDYTSEAIFRGYQALVDQFYPGERVLLGALTTWMRYAGPREAVFHALIRRNYGCTHFVVGRDHAGVGNYYGKYEAQNLVMSLSDELGIEILPLQGPYFCSKCDMITSAKTCRHEMENPEWVTHISGSDMRAILVEGKHPDSRIMRPEIVAALSDTEVFIKEAEE